LSIRSYAPPPSLDSALQRLSLVVALSSSGPLNDSVPGEPPGTLIRSPSTVSQSGGGSTPSSLLSDTKDLPLAQFLVKKLLWLWERFLLHSLSASQSVVYTSSWSLLYSLFQYNSISNVAPVILYRTLSHFFVMQVLLWTLVFCFFYVCLSPLISRDPFDRPTFYVPVAIAGLCVVSIFSVVYVLLKTILKEAKDGQKSARNTFSSMLEKNDDNNNNNNNYYNNISIKAQKRNAVVPVSALPNN
jgi:hypothetical protein